MSPALIFHRFSFPRLIHSLPLNYDYYYTSRLRTCPRLLFFGLFASHSVVRTFRAHNKTTLVCVGVCVKLYCITRKKDFLLFESRKTLREERKSWVFYNTKLFCSTCYPFYKLFRITFLNPNPDKKRSRRTLSVIWICIT